MGAPAIIGAFELVLREVLEIEVSIYSINT